MLWKDNREEVNEGLYAISCPPDLRVKLWSSCSVNGVRYNTVDRERERQTQNSGVLVDGTHNNLQTEFYGQVKEIVQLTYNSNLESIRTVVLFRCDWFSQDGKARAIKDDGHFRSINIERFWYKSDPFILATQAKKVFYVQDTQFGENWRVVQKFEHRSMYDVNEIELSTVHQDETGSDNELVLQDSEDDGIDEPAPVHRRVHGEKSTVAGNLQVLINRREEDMAEISDDEDHDDCEDDTIFEYFSDNDRDPMECNDDD
jgi:hypothetical protein